MSAFPAHGNVGGFPTFRLDYENELRALRVGCRRRFNAYRLKQARARHFNGSQWAAHIEAACSECAVHLWTGLPWTGEHQYDPPFLLPDVGDDIEVRQTGTKPVLRIDQRDLDEKAERRFVLAVGWAPEYIFHGWAFPEEATMHPDWKRVYPERVVWEMPASRLRSMQTL